MRIIPILFSTPMVKAILEGRKSKTRRVVKPQPGDHLNDDGYMTSILSRCRYQPGDILWVRETWAVDKDRFAEAERIFYKADYLASEFEESDSRFEVESDFLHCLKWRPSIHMPREAARLFLLVKDVRVERLQDISEEDVLAEGENSFITFSLLWDSLNAKKYPWESNPFVWAITYERTERPVTP